jgi:hypothetical protein
MLSHASTHDRDRPGLRLVPLLRRDGAGVAAAVSF